MQNIIDLNRLDAYRENNRIEAKKALGGLPRSIWETYSAFANTLGGILLLGVEERKDGSFLAHDLPDPERYIREFWDLIRDKRIASDNILQKQHVQIVRFEGKRILAIYVPKAGQERKPVYIGEDVYSGTYRRDGEGDYHCSRAQIDAMLQDAKRGQEDEQVFEDLDMQAFCAGSISRFRHCMEKKHFGYLWQDLDDLAFLEKINAVGLLEDGKYHPTAAGLLMFGREDAIVLKYPCYALFYQEMGRNGIAENVIASDSGEFSGNLFDFYLLVYRKLKQCIRVPEIYEGQFPAGETPIHRGVQELLVNCLVHADYRQKQGVIVRRSGTRITFENPGCFGVDTETAKRGCQTNPIHPVLIQMFHLIRVGNGEGRGISKIYELWRGHGFALPKISEQLEPERTQISVSISRRKSVPLRTKNAPAVAGGGVVKKKKKAARQAIYEFYRQQIIDYVTTVRRARTSEIETLLDLEHPKVKSLLEQMVEDGILETEGGMGNLCYRLKR